MCICYKVLQKHIFANNLYISNRTLILLTLVVSSTMCLVTYQSVITVSQLGHLIWFRTVSFGVCLYGQPHREKKREE